MTQLVVYTKSDDLQHEFPEFQTLDVYGTYEEPLFPGQQVQELLGISNINYNRDYEEGIDYKKAISTAKDNKLREQNMFTEQGLYNIIFSSKTDLGRKFRRFVTVILRELRTKGHVTLQTALEKLQLESKKDKERIQMLDAVCEEEHEKRVAAERKSDMLYMSRFEYAEENNALETKLKFKEPVGQDALIAQSLKDKLCNKVYVELCKPTDDMDYDADDDDPCEDEQYILGLSKTKDNKNPVAELYCLPKMSLKNIHDILIKRGFGVPNQKGAMIANRYRCSIADLKSAFDDMILFDNL